MTHILIRIVKIMNSHYGDVGFPIPGFSPGGLLGGGGPGGGVGGGGGLPATVVTLKFADTPPIVATQVNSWLF